MNTELFSGKAEVYANARPSYPPEAIDYIRNLVSPSAIFADIGAGTGKFTELIAKHGHNIFAVEPNTDMLKQLAVTLSSYSNAKVIAGPAENTTLPNNSIDIIICAQALHWFDINAFRQECNRIGKTDCIVVAVYNVNPAGSSAIHSQNAPKAFFQNPTVREFPNPQFYTREQWINYMSTHSTSPLQSDARYDTHISEVNAIFDDRSVNGTLCNHVITKVFSERRNHE